MIHKLLQKQAKKYLNDKFLDDKEFQNFLLAINDSYMSFDRDKELLNHAFALSEKEYKELYENLNHENELKKISIEKLTQLVKLMDKDISFDNGKDELLIIIDYFNSIIEKKNITENSLKHTLELLQTLLSNLNSGIIVEDENRKILFTNDLFCKTFSIPHPASEMIGFDCSESAEESKDLFTNPDEFVARINSILEQKQPVFGDILTFVNGTILERDYVPIYIENTYRGHLWKYNNITERKKSENQLRELSNIQNAILNGTDYSIIYTDQNGMIQSFNKGAEQMLGYKAKEIINIHSPFIFHDPWEVSKKAIELSDELGYEIKSGFDVFVEKSRRNIYETNEWTYIKKNGQRITVILTVSTLRNQANEIIGYMGVARDITEQKKAQEALRHSEERYRNIVEKSTDIIYKTNKFGFFSFVNPVAERITGFKQEELLNKHFAELIKEEYRKAAILFYHKQVKHKKNTTYYEFPIITKSGEERWIGQSVQLSEMGSKDYELTALAIDITDRKTYEKKLVETNKNLELLKNLINNTSDAIQVSYEDGTLVYLNNEASVRLGIASEEAGNYNVKDFESIFKENGTWEKHVEEVKTKGTLVIEGENFNRNTQTKFPVEVTVKYIVIDNKGYIIANSRDITERKQIQDHINKQREKYQSIINNMNLGLLEVDLNDKVQYCNPGFQTLSGYSIQEILGKKATEILIPKSHKELVIEKAGQRAKGVSDMYEMPVKNKAGETRWWMISGAPNYDDNGQLIGSIGIHLDITQQKQLELELELAKSKAEESAKAKESFLANMSHEIRTPLNAIIGMIRELSKERLSDKQNQYVYNTSVASQHLLSIINNILDISKIEAGEFQLEKHHFELSTIISDVNTIMKDKAGEKNIFLKVDHPDDIPHYFIGDPSRLRQVLLNLIGNAIKFTHQGGVSIGYKVEPVFKNTQVAYITIKDTGVGMKESYLKNIFNKFTQEDSSTSRKYGGTGLGMAITQELVQLMNGSISIESTKDVGTTVYLKFLFEIGNAEQTDNKKNNQESINLKETRILLVEDNEFNRTVAINTLNYHKCLITEAEDGKQAIDILESGEQFDIILMDLQMPVMDGFETTQKIRNELKLQTPIIALTANAFKSELEQCLHTGMNDYVTKPFEEDVLISTIQKHLDKQRITGSQQEPAIQEKLYDLNKLLKISHNDKEYIKKMITIFTEQINTSLKQIEDAYTTKDLDTIHKIAHKIKPSIDSMGIESIRQEIRDIESIAKDGIDSDKLRQNIQTVDKVLKIVVEQLKQENSDS